MPNKIVQLVDNENNNIYPVAGSLAQDSVTTSTINDEAVTTAKIADGAATSNKLSLTTSTQTLTFKNVGESTMGTGTATMIQLDDSGLTMLCFRGGTGGKTTQPGTYEVKTRFETPFTDILSASVNGWCAGDSESYLAYNSIVRASGGGDLYIRRNRSDGEELELQVGLIIIGYMS